MSFNLSQTWRCGLYLLTLRLHHRNKSMHAGGKLRKKEAGESKKSGKLPRTGLAMTCSNCNVRGHNKRGCPQRVESSTREEPSNVDKGNGKTSGLGRPKKAQAKVSILQRGQEEDHQALSASPGHAKRSRRPPQHLVHLRDTEVRGRPLRHPECDLRDCKEVKRKTSGSTLVRLDKKSAEEDQPLAAASAPPTCPSLLITMLDLTHLRLRLTNSNKGRGRGRGSTTSYKRQTGIGMGVFQDENGFKALNPGMSSCKIFSTGTTKVTKSVIFLVILVTNQVAPVEMEWKSESQQENSRNERGTKKKIKRK
ncbi:hypothetical protein H5410_048924 [Solanum commersonii]|uniref:Uncharacterized protein n=1 Tax=Solanum commersonii TaxID=4109 RepID=A0A9J5XL40_SOLCO|nr:hypothetical protein H5410_048924 [Solanum commersonii]